MCVACEHRQGLGGIREKVVLGHSRTQARHVAQCVAGCGEGIYNAIIRAKLRGLDRDGMCGY